MAINPPDGGSMLGIFSGVGEALQAGDKAKQERIKNQLGQRLALQQEQRQAVALDQQEAEFEQFISHTLP